MWEEGAYIYGTPGVHNNFPFFYIYLVISFFYIIIIINTLVIVLYVKIHLKTRKKLFLFYQKVIKEKKRRIKMRFCAQTFLQIEFFFFFSLSLLITYFSAIISVSLWFIISFLLVMYAAWSSGTTKY